MSHNCPPEWVYLPLFGCYQSMDQFYMVLTNAVAITIGLAVVATAIGLYQRSRNLRKDHEGET